MTMQHLRWASYIPIAGLTLLTAFWQNEPEPNPDSCIVDDIAAYLKRFVLLPEESLYSLVSIWVLGTHVHQHFDFFGYLFIHSPEPQSGKSRLLELLHEIAFNPTEIMVSPTHAVLFRTAENTTHLLDEVDGWTNKDELRNVLNAGFQKGRTVMRMEETEGQYGAKKFKVFAPRALAGIGTAILDGVTRDRTFMIRMVRQKQTERRERFHSKKLKTDLDRLRKAISQWIKRNQAAICDRYENGQFLYLERFQDRTIDVSQSLAAIMEIAFHNDGQALETAKIKLVKAISITRGEQQTNEGAAHEILRELTKLAYAHDPLVGSASELAEKMKGAIDSEIDEKNVSDVLLRYDFKSKSTRLEGGQPRYRYHLPYAALRDLCERYIGAAPPVEEQRGT